MRIPCPDWLLHRIERRAQQNPITPIYGSDGSMYMERWTVFKREWLWVRLHVTHRSDEDREMHDHPWRNLSWILRTGYVEHMPGKSVQRRAGDLVWRRLSDRHRLELVDNAPSTSLFFTGRWRQMWGFFEEDGTKVPWRIYIRRKEKRIRIMKENRHDRQANH